MKSAMAVDVKTRAIAGSLAVTVTLLSFGGQLSLVEHYVQSGPAISAAEYAAWQADRMTRRTTCANTEQSGGRNVPVRLGAVAAAVNEKA